MSKYDPYRDFLLSLDSDEVVVTLDQLNAMAALPDEARQHEWWWRSTGDRPSGNHGDPWKEAGFEVEVDLPRNAVSFVRRRG